ncbi:hypothetical protein HMPREF2826_03090 [Olsenella sp. HMSC062G07]|nr:hypothetical protein HMPREF2826_03090 [Olsenella sp. HMSC062G07]
MDNGNSDGYRPDSLAVDLLANGETTDRSLTLDEANGWAGSFENIPYLDSDGKRIDYTLKERSVSSVGDLSKYHGTISWTSDKTQVYLTNVHEPETVSIHGHKVWNNDPENAYHSYVDMCLLADGKTRLDDGTYLPAKTVYEGEDGSWSFSFDNMPKYHDGGVPYEYSLQEQRGDQNYSPSISGDVSTGFTVTNTYHPFGDLVISKAVTGGTEETKGQRFTFDVQLWNQDGSPLRGTTTWQRSDGSTGSITDGVGVVDLADGEAITLKDIPAYATYSVTERQTSGYHASSSMLQGYISANRQSDAAFSNEYSTLGRASIGARKVLDGRTLINHQFRFLLLDGDGEVVSVGSNDASGAVTFGSLRYSAADDGKTFSYTMREEDAGMPGYTYDSREYKVEVTPHDMGDGTMEVEVRYLDGNGSRLDPQDVSFGNSYTATGSTHLTAYKVLKDGRLERGAFSFELHGVDTAPLPEVTSATNAVDGTVNWGDITYSQKDIGKTYTYWADEMAGTDESVAYSAERRAWSVSVFDNGDGTLSFATKNISTDGLFDADGNVVPGWDASKASATDQLPVITNQSKSGELDISKILTDDEETQGQKDRSFTFKVTLTGPSVTSDTVKSYQVTNGVETFGTRNSQAGSSSDKPDQSSKSADMAPAPAKSLLQTLSDAWGGLVGSVASLFVPTPALANTTDDSGVTVWKTWGTARWGIDGDGTLWLEPESGSASDTGYLGKIPAYSFEVWDDHNADVKEIMTKGRVVLPVESNHLFYNFVNCTYADVSGLDPSRSKDIQSMFYGCKKLKTIVGISDWDTRTVLYPYQIFEGCESLTEIDLSGWDLHNAWQGDDFFAGCKSLRKITLGPQFRSSKRGMPDIPAYHTADPYDGKWMLEGKGIVLSAADLRDTYSPELAGTWVWAIVTYPLKFDANGGTGAMQDQTLAKGEKTPIPANSFTRFGYTFAGWNTKPDGTGDAYADQAQIAIRQDTTLYAQWTKADNTVTMEDNGFTVTLKGGETAKIDALPSGTAYQVYEETPSGWVLVSSSNASGSIEPLKTSTATFTNKYEQGKVSANIVAHKTLDGLPVDEGAFSFTLTGKDAAPMPTDAQGEVKTLANAAGGGIDFGSIVFDKAGTYSYQLAEVAGTDESFTYDTHVEDVTVTVTDDGQGNLSAAVAYSGGKASGPTFANATKPGSLTVSKTVSAGKPDQEFTFDVTLTNPKNSAEPEVRTLTVKGGESATIDSLPAGTSYSVVERPSSGWTQTASEGATGTISANVASTASFTNSYAASGSQDIVIHKELVEATGATHPIEGGRFTFTIEGIDGAPLPATTVASNEPSPSAQGQGGDSAAVDFGSVTFQKEDMYTYRIREAAGSDEGIRYSDEVITLTVKTKDNGDGTLSCTPSYSGASGEGDDTITNSLVSKPPAPTPPEPNGAEPELLSQTGDSDPFGGLTTPVLGIAGCALAVAGYRRRRREGGSRGDA